MYALYQASLFFTSIGGAYSLDSSTMTTSMYDSLRKYNSTDLLLFTVLKQHAEVL